MLRRHGGRWAGSLLLVLCVHARVALSQMIPTDLETMAAGGTTNFFPGGETVSMQTRGEGDAERKGEVHEEAEGGMQKGQVQEEDISQLVHSIGPQVRGAQQPWVKIKASFLPTYGDG
jgi:hypothetical protein